MTNAIHPLIRLRLKITATERGAACARKRGREDIAIKFDKATMLYHTALRLGRKALADEATARIPANAIPAPEGD